MDNEQLKELLVMFFEKNEAYYKDIVKAIPKSFLNDFYFCCSMLKNNPGMFKYVSDKLKDDEDIAFIAVSGEPLLLRYAGDRVKDNEHVVLKALKTYSIIRDEDFDVCEDGTFKITINPTKFDLILSYASERLRKKYGETGLMRYYNI